MNNDPKLGALSALGASKIRGFRIEKFAQAAKTFNHSVTKFPPLRAIGLKSNIHHRNIAIVKTDRLLGHPKGKMTEAFLFN
jgi:hypothetical protein